MSEKMLVTQALDERDLLVKKITDKCGLKIGQIIFDINGEYANANKQDNGSISDIYAEVLLAYKNLCINKQKLFRFPQIRPRCVVFTDHHPDFADRTT